MEEKVISLGIFPQLYKRSGLGTMEYETGTGGMDKRWGISTKGTGLRISLSKGEVLAHSL